MKLIIKYFYAVDLFVEAWKTNKSYMKLTILFGKTLL